MKGHLAELRNDLALNASERDKIAGKRFFKEDVNLLGVKSSVLKDIAKEHYKKLEDKSKSNVFGSCEELFKSGILEESFVACQWSYSVYRQYEKDDFNIFEKWVSKYVTNWATCDTLCNHSVGTIIEMYPDLIERLKVWTGSDNRWVRRAAAVSLIIPARKGKFLADIFHIADVLLTDTDDMVRKGYGWMLKAASQAHQEDVFAYVIRNKSTMPRTALRYAIEKMPADLKAIAMSRN